MGSPRRIAELLARTAAACALVYVVFDWLLGAVVLRGLTASAQGALRSIDRPVVLTSLSSAGRRVVLSSHLSGIEQPFATWNAENLPIFMVATLGLALAAPARGVRRRLETILLAVLVSVPTMLATVVIQIQVTAANAARTGLALRLYDAHTESLLAAFNQGIGVAMLLVPAAVFAFAYVRYREETRVAGDDDRVRLRGLAAAVAGMLGLLAVLAAIGAGAVDPRPGLARVVERNPGSTRAYVALASHDALVGLGSRGTASRSGSVDAD